MQSIEKQSAAVIIAELRRQLAARDEEIADNRREMEKATNSFRTVVALKNRRIKELEWQVSSMKERKAVENDDSEPPEIENLPPPSPTVHNAVTSLFLGTWNNITSENLDAYMKEVGVGLMIRSVAYKLKPTLTFEITGDEWTMTSVSIFQTHVTKFRLGEEIELQTVDGREVTAKFELIGSKLLQTERDEGGGKDSRIVRTVDGTILTIVAECNGVNATRIYEKACES